MEVNNIVSNLYTAFDIDCPLLVRNQSLGARLLWLHVLDVDIQELFNLKKSKGFHGRKIFNGNHEGNNLTQMIDF